MRGILIAMLIGAAATTSFALGYFDAFEYPDGTFPPKWTWTGDPRGGGSFLVYDGAFTHVSGGSVYYFRSDTRDGRPGLGAVYGFGVKGTNWIFAWRITTSDTMQGRCLWLSHDDLWGSWGYTFAEFSWETLDPAQYPDGQYMWHNGTPLRLGHHATDGPLEGWHIVLIDDQSETHAVITVDGEDIFDEPYEFIEDGFQGIGCVVDGEMTPAFDDIGGDWPDPVEQTTWGSMKALFR
jgi:hypothetical protein